MILSGEAILERLERGEIFRERTWDRNSLKEASYALRLALDWLMLDDEYYSPEKKYPKDYIEIKPGRIAILSTVEALDMPADLVGKIGIRLNHALQGITGLMGIQVDPLYGNDKDDERLFVRVANLGNESVILWPNDQIFTFELHELLGGVPVQDSGKPATWDRIRKELVDQNHASWTYVTHVSSDLSETSTKIQNELDRETRRIRDYLQPVVLFGVFLIAATILSVAIATTLDISNTWKSAIPEWALNVSWTGLIVAICMVVATAMIVIVVATFRKPNGQ